MTTQTDQTYQTDQTDQTEISTLISQFFRALDDRKFDDGWARSYFTDDVRTVTPIGSSEGIEATEDTKEAVERYAHTQHMATDVLIDVETAAGVEAAEERATASWNALMTHVHHDATLQQRRKDANPLFTVGGRYETELRRTQEGWRISFLSVQVIWTTGQPPVLPAEFQPRPTPTPTA